MCFIVLISTPDSTTDSETGDSFREDVTIDVLWERDSTTDEPDGLGGTTPVLIRQIEIHHRPGYMEFAELRIGTYIVNPVTGERERTVAIVYDRESFMVLADEERDRLLDELPLGAERTTNEGYERIIKYNRAVDDVLMQVAQRIRGLSFDESAS